MNTSLKNQYVVLRHGESKANVAEIILSHLENGIKEEFTLTKKGEEQVIDSIKKAKSENFLDRNMIIYSSPFSRCKRTAEIAKEILEVKDEIHFDDRLRERNFGDLEKTHNSNYQKVWDEDAKNPDQKNDNVESVSEVWQRICSFIEDLEKQYQGKKILLVSHGDALQILMAGFLKQSPGHHRKIEHLHTAEVRKLK